MSENIFRPNGDFIGETDRLKEKYLIRIAALERELMKARRGEKILREVERRYLSLMDSCVFLFAVLSPSGSLRFMNRRAEEFFGFHPKIGTGVSFQSLVAPEYAENAESALMDSVEGPTRATLALTRAGGALGWLDVELSWSVYHGEPSILLVATDVTELMVGKETKPPSSTSWALCALANCPGLLCFAVDRNGMLLYATRGYREVAGRFLGHGCVCGSPYPVSVETAFDMDLDELIRDAFRGETSMTELVERHRGGCNRWSVTAAPMRDAQSEVVGAVVNLVPAAQFQPARPAPAPPLPSPVNAASEARPARPPEENAVSRTEFLNAVRQMLVVLNEEGVILEANECFLEATKFTGGELSGRMFADLALAGDPVNEGLREKISALAGGVFSEETDCKISGRDGEVFSLNLSAAPIRRGGTAAILLSCENNTKLRRAEEQLKRVFATDVSTGTLNRIGMERALGGEVERAVRYGLPLALIMLNIDDFRLLNERLGHAACDRVLKEVAAALKSGVCPTDFAGCRGGDDFMILTPSAFPEACDLAESLRALLETRTFGDDVRLTVSVGVAEFRKEMDISTFVDHAWEAMREAGRSGGNCVARAGLPVEEQAATR